MNATSKNTERQSSILRQMDIAIVALLIVFAIVFVARLVESVTGEDASREFQYRDTIVQECIATERYTFDQCVTIAGGQ
jgi:hypothetical protein